MMAVGSVVGIHSAKESCLRGGLKIFGNRSLVTDILEHVF